MSIRAELAAGIVPDIEPSSDQDVVPGQAAELLAAALTPTTVWQSGYVPLELRGEKAYGQSLRRWRSTTLTSGQRRLLDTAWSRALPERGYGMRNFLRLRVNTPEDVRHLREIGNVDGMTIVPSLDARGGWAGFEWRWPLRVGVLPGPSADAWLVEVRNSSHLDTVFDAELCSTTGAYDIVVVNATELSSLSAEMTDLLKRVACVIVAGDGEVEPMLRELDGRIQPPIAVAFQGPPEAWWRWFFHELCHDLPVDVAVEQVVRNHGVDGMMAGPAWGLDITASAHWFAAVAPDLPALEPGLRDYPALEWASEDGGTTRGVNEVRQANRTGARLRAVVPEVAIQISGPGWQLQAEAEAGAEPEATPSFDEDQPPEEQPAQSRRLVARMYDGQTVLESVLPPTRNLTLGVRIAIPERGDVPADEVIPDLVEERGPSSQLEVLVSSDVWQEQPPPQTISLPRDKKEEPSSWAVFALTTPAAGSFLSIEIVVLYQGKPLQAATYGSPVRASAVPGERPTLRTFRLSGPDEPTDDLRPVDVALNGRGAELRRCDNAYGSVLITDTQAKLDLIEERVSKVLGVTGAPDSFDDPSALALLVELARIGSDLARTVAPLHLGTATRITIDINPDTRVLPLELVYAGTPPDPRRARLCRHVTEDAPPPLGQACDRAGPRTVCPYAFWGLHRSISRIVWSEKEARPVAVKATVPTQDFSILYAATVIADDGASDPKPSDAVLAAAQRAFSAVTRVTSWRAWRKAIRDDRPNLLVVLGHTTVGAETRLYIGRKSSLSRRDISAALLRSADSPPPLVLLIACSTLSLGDPFGTLPGAFTAEGAGAVVGTLSKLVGPQGAAATTHLLASLHDAVGQESVGDAVARARYTLVKEKRPIGLLLVAHGELDTKVGA